ncbi:hypothetical protein FSW04_05820 [Baekduia soli]|uniref:DUF2171 domain-containing protein n=1 Tax=Baekduia soli TaxID=496014 RepID=A0A5B8U281_9ACTN|nr:hypothetical protein [Baekduia soli]QEC47154.1 hypothetical protein FSW04_05820 [Baekduia soli]
MTGDEDPAISYKVLRRGTPVRTADGQVLGRVRRVHEAARENIFDGIDVDTKEGVRFVDAPEVARITERQVTVTFALAHADDHVQDRGSPMARRLRNAGTVRRARRAGRELRDRWDRR